MTGPDSRDAEPVAEIEARYCIDCGHRRADHPGDDCTGQCNCMAFRDGEPPAPKEQQS